MNTTLFSQYLFTTQQIREGEAGAAKMAGIELYELMERAGHAVFDLCQRCYPQAKKVAVLCGGGNNGGDGYVTARLLVQAGIQVTLFQNGDAARLSGDAARARDAWLATQNEIIDSQTFYPASHYDVIIDALLGTGLNLTVRPNMAQLIERINQSGAPVISVDVPSGLSADTGRVLGAAVKASHCITFIGTKQGLVTGQARAYTGELHFAGLEVEDKLLSLCTPSAVGLQSSDLQRYRPQRSADAHKGDNGKLLAVGGNHGMGGAIRMAAQASMRCGAGLVSVLTHADSVLALQTACPEVMAQQWPGDPDTLNQKCQWAGALLLGPGLGRDEWAQQAFSGVSHFAAPKIFDADALNLLAEAPYQDEERIITPHPGEAARLLHCRVSEVEADRFAAVKELQRRYAGVVVLKGAGTLIYDGQSCHVCLAGNAGMATAGMGDMLSGVIAGLLAQKMPLNLAARLGVLLHSCAGDLSASQQGSIGLMATDLLPYLRLLINRDMES